MVAFVQSPLAVVIFPCAATNLKASMEGFAPADQPKREYLSLL
jgi:hypothetical protein